MKKLFLLSEKRLGYVVRKSKRTLILYGYSNYRFRSRLS